MSESKDGPLHLQHNNTIGEKRSAWNIIMLDETILLGRGYAGFLEKNIRSFSWRRYPASPPDVGP